MEKLEVHTLICKRDVQWWINTVNLFKHHSGLDFTTVVHEDGSMDDGDCEKLSANITNLKIYRRSIADAMMRQHLKDYPLCTHFRLAEHHTIFRIKLFDPFLLTESNNCICMDADILFCENPEELIQCINNKTGFYFRDSWSSYCVPFRDEDSNKDIIRCINAGMTYCPTKYHYSLNEIEACLEILYAHGSRGATHPFLEQNCIAYMISQQIKKGESFVQLPHPKYCIPTFGKFEPNHGCTALHLNSSPLVGLYKKEHYAHELTKAGLPVIID